MCSVENMQFVIRISKNIFFCTFAKDFSQLFLKSFMCQMKKIIFFCFYFLCFFICCFVFLPKNAFSQDNFLVKMPQNLLYFQDKTKPQNLWQNPENSILLQHTIQKNNAGDGFLNDLFFQEKIKQIQHITHTDSQNAGNPHYFLSIFYENYLQKILSNQNFQYYLQQKALYYQQQHKPILAMQYWEKLQTTLKKTNTQNIQIDTQISTELLHNYIALGDYTQAYKQLDEVNNNKNNFTNTEKGKYAYFFGKKDTQNIEIHWKKAENYFLKETQIKETQAESILYLCKMYYVYCHFDKIIHITKDFTQDFFLKNDFYKNLENLETNLNKNTSKQAHLDILQYTSEAFFYQKDYKNAVSYYKIWQKIAENPQYKNHISCPYEVLFHYAWALYQTNEWAESGAILEKIGFSQQTQSDIAFLYAGEAYLQQNDKKHAKEAFAQANRITKNEDLKQHTHLLLAKLATELKLFGEASQYWQSFKKNYPERALRENADVFIQKNDLKRIGFKNFHKNLDSLQKNNPQLLHLYIQIALDKSLEKTENPQEKQENEQIVTDLLQQKSLSLPQQRNLKFTLAERYLQDQKPLLAMPIYQELLDWRAKSDDFSILSHYGLGYAYYQTGQYMLANTHFQLCIVGNAPNFSIEQKNDAFIRLADGYFALNEKTKAKKYYEIALKMGEKTLTNEVKNYIAKQIQAT